MPIGKLESNSLTGFTQVRPEYISQSLKPDFILVGSKAYTYCKPGPGRKMQNNSWGKGQEHSQHIIYTARIFVLKHFFEKSLIAI